MNNKIKMKEINEIRSQIGSLNKKLSEAKDRLEIAGLRALGLELGDKIIIKRRGAEQIVSVTGCDVRYGAPIPIGVKVKKNGEISAVSAGYIKDWRKAEVKS